MGEKPKDNVRKMFTDIDDIRVVHPSGEVVGMAGFVRGQNVDIKQGDIIDSGWKITGFDITDDERMVTIQKGESQDAREETIPLKKLREMNPLK